MESTHPRIERERQTIERMTHIYCQSQHGSIRGSLCPECQDLLLYAGERLRKCPFQERKSTCAKCTIHCYQPVYREKVRVMMRYAGPRMLFHHPVLAALHMIDGFRKAPVLERRKKERQ